MAMSSDVVNVKDRRRAELIERLKRHKAEFISLSEAAASYGFQIKVEQLDRLHVGRPAATVLNFSLIEETKI